MKISVLLLLFSVYTFQGFTQSVTIGHESVPVEYYRMPDEPLNPGYSTYSVEVDARSGELFRTNLNEHGLEGEFMMLEGYDKVFTNGDIHIQALIGDFQVYSERTGTQSTKSKDKDGKEITRIQYYVELRYSLPLALEVKDRTGKRLMNESIYNISSDQSWRSSLYNSRSELDRYWNSSRTSKLSELQRNRIRQGMQEVRDMINNTFGYRLINENERFEKIGRKKHPKYQAYHTAVENLKKAFKLMDANRSLEEVRKAAQPALDFYKSEKVKCIPGDKDAERLFHIGQINLGLAYFWLEDFAEAKKYANAILACDGKDKDAERLLENAIRVEDSIRRAGQNSRHQITVGSKS